MNELQIFNNQEFGTIRSTLIKNEPYFVGKDVAEILGYSNPSKAIRDHVDEEDKGVNEMDTPGGKQQIVLISESGLYSLVISSKLDTAKKFKRWVTSEVLPAIRKNGGYIYGQEKLTDEELMAKALIMAQQTIAERNIRIGTLEKENSHLMVQNEIFRPKAEYFDELVDRKLLTNFTDTAKELGVKRKKLLNFLSEHKYIYRDKSGNIKPYAQYADTDNGQGLFHIKDCSNEKTEWAGTQTLITVKGKETFRLLLIEG